MLGGYTYADTMRMPSHTMVTRFSMETLAVCKSLSVYEAKAIDELGIMKNIHGELVGKIADEMLVRNLVEFQQIQESPDRVVIRATARIFRPEV